MRFPSCLSVLVSFLAVFAVAVTAHSADPSICDEIIEIQSIPMKGEGGDDVFLKLMEAGELAIPCLIDRITDTTPVPDPRMAPTFHGTVVGDIAVFMLARITERSFADFLPQEAADAYQVEGIYGYFRYVSDPTHRQAVQEQWRGWWKENGK